MPPDQPSVSVHQMHVEMPADLFETTCQNDFKPLTMQTSALTAQHGQEGVFLYPKQHCVAEQHSPLFFLITCQIKPLNPLQIAKSVLQAIKPLVRLMAFQKTNNGCKYHSV